VNGSDPPASGRPPPSARSLDALQAALRDTTRLSRLLTVLSEEIPLPALLDRALATLSELFASDLVALLEPGRGGAYSPVAVLGLPEGIPGWTPHACEGSHLEEALRARAPLSVPVAAGDPRVDPTLRELGLRVVAWLPLAAEAPTGEGDPRSVLVLVLGRCRAVPFAAGDLDLGVALGGQVALALERHRVRERLHQAEARLREAEKLALAGRLALSIAEDASNPLAYLRSNLASVQERLPTIAAALRAAGASGATAADGLAEVVADSLEGARRMGRLVDELRKVGGSGSPGEPGPVDLRAAIAASMAELAPAGPGAPEVRQERGEPPAPLAWAPYALVRTTLTGLLRFLAAEGMPRTRPPAPISVRDAALDGRPAVIIEDPGLLVSPEEQRRLLELRLSDGAALRLGLAAAQAFQQLLRHGAEVSTAPRGTVGLTLRLVLPEAPGTGEAEQSSAPAWSCR
jgi:signal transduction histidine kinase